jgi:hypothetical protein
MGYNGFVTDREQAIRDLVWEWAPLGEEEPTDPHLPKDEYDWLIRGVERKLDEGADARQVASYLTNAVRTRYGLDDPPAPEALAERLVAL